MYDVSVIIPTHNRASTVVNSVKALANQRMPPSRFEVVVVADGCEDRTVEELNSLETGFGLRVITQTASGAAAARNAGAELAQGLLLLFLDDDMLADDGLLQAHWQSQISTPCLLLGFFSAPAWLRSDRPIAAFSNEWWDDRFSRLRPAVDCRSFYDVCTGQMSVFRSSFFDVGCFDSELGFWAGEDFEFGIRWLQSGGRVRYSPAARSQHLDRPSIDKSLNRAYAEGRGHVIIARRHREHFADLPLRTAFDGRARIYIGLWRPLSPRKARVYAFFATPAAKLFDMLKLRRIYSRVFAIAKTARYWAGVFDEIDGAEGLRNFIEDVPYEQTLGDFDSVGEIDAVSASNKPPAPENTNLPAISVVVCTRDRPKLLRQCLDALQRLNHPKFEVIVVDNASATDDSRKVVSRTGFRYVREDVPGLNWARNRGWREATNELVAYIDDDAWADEFWIAEICRAFRRSETAAVTGLILPAELKTTAQQIFESYGNGMSKGTKAKLFEPDRMTPEELIRAQDVGVGTNMAFRKSILKDLNGFDTALDVGTPSCGGGDLDMLHRVLIARHDVAYRPTARVRHRHRRDMEGLIRQIENNGRSYGVYLIKLWRDGNVPKSNLLKFSIWIWGRWLVGRVVLKLLGRHRLPMRMLAAELQGALSAPHAYRSTYRNDRQLRNRMASNMVDEGAQHG